MDKVPGPDLSVILPSYRNAALALASAEELAAYLEGLDLSWEIILVDDGGGDFAREPLGWTLGRGRLSQPPHRDQH